MQRSQACSLEGFNAFIIQSEKLLGKVGGKREQDKSTPEEQSSWDSFKTMTPELSIVPGEQKDRMELHNKTWDSSSANTPDSSEGDFQTEV
ncbi:hypothetical protein PAMP_007855 [Pampus punctatissimus]